MVQRMIVVLTLRRQQKIDVLGAKKKEERSHDVLVLGAATELHWSWLQLVKCPQVIMK